MEIIKLDDFSPIQEKFITQGLVKKEDFDREVSFALQHINKNPFIQQKCTKASILAAVLNIAQTGLTLDPVKKFAYLVPRYNNEKREYQAILEPSYMGLIKLLTDSGSVKAIDAQVIYEGDEIVVDLASKEKVKKHVPYFLNGKEKGDIRGVYCVATLYDGVKQCELMSFADICEVRGRSESYKTFEKKQKEGGNPYHPTWVTDTAEMSRKTVVKRIFKYLPKPDKADNIHKAIELDHIANGFTEQVSYTTIGMIESLLRTSNLTEDEKEIIEGELSLVEYEFQAKKLIKMLNDNQLDPVTERGSASQREIQEFVSRRSELDR